MHRSVCVIFDFSHQYNFLNRSFFALLGSFIPRYFAIFVAMVNRTVSLISLFDLSLSVYKSARDFYA